MSVPNELRLGSAKERSWRASTRLVALLSITMLGAGSLQAASLRGSRSSLHRQNEQARQHDYSYLRTSSEVKRFAEKGYLVPIRGNDNYRLANVSFPYARPEVDLFLNRLGAQYRSACGDTIIVTSLTRPTTRQPRNASPLSVHPTGMAMDLRLPQHSRCRNWLESTLLSLERSGVLEATREHRPPHYHVALYPKRYTDYLARMTGEKPALTGRSTGPADYTVKRGDTLWDIARQHGTSVSSIKSANNMRSTTIKPGQRLRIP